MKIKPLNERRIIRIKNANGDTNFGGLTFVGNKLYTIKTRTGNTSSTISYYPNFKKTERTNHTYENSFGHGNSMTYFDNELYVAPCGKYCGTVNIKTWKYKKLESDMYMTAISHYTGPMFLALSRGDGNGNYTVAIMNRTGDKLVTKKKWTIKNPYHEKGYTVSQGMGFRQSKKRLYIVFSHSNMKSNIVLRFALEKSSPDYLFKSKVSDIHYELEDVGFDANDNIYIGTNERENLDALYQVR